MDHILKIGDREYYLEEQVSYPNGGYSYFYTCDDTVIILDKDICIKNGKEPFPYHLITNKQNKYMHEYARVFRFLNEDREEIEETINQAVEVGKLPSNNLDRADFADSSPLEYKFEDNFASVYGRDAIRYLNKEYSITDNEGNPFFLDYYVRRKTGDFAVEENGVDYHHPQKIGKDDYRKQLRKQNACTQWGIKLFRFSTEDCKSSDWIEGEIESYFGSNTDEL